MKLGGHPLLLVEDNDDDVLLMRYALRDAKITNPLAVVTTGQQAIEYLAAACANRDSLRPVPGVVFLDLKLPFVSGFEVLEWIRGQAALKGIVVVVLTSSDQPADIRRAYALGANSYLVKPPNPAELDNLEQSFSQYWIHHSQFANR